MQQSNDSDFCLSQIVFLEKISENLDCINFTQLLLSYFVSALHEVGYEVEVLYKIVPSRYPIVILAFLIELLERQLQDLSFVQTCPDDDLSILILNLYLIETVLLIELFKKVLDNEFLIWRIDLVSCNTHQSKNLNILYFSVDLAIRFRKKGFC